MTYALQQLPVSDFPPLLHEIPEPPEQLNFRGVLPPADLPLITVVGARKYTTYGEQVVEHLIRGLSEYEIGIVSGLALGIDSLAHKAALQHGLYTLAIPGSGLNKDILYPRSHVRLAQQILEADGGLLSEFDPSFRATKWSFIKRNRLMAGISRLTIIIEATERSGTLTTARMCVDYNRELGVVPGNIFSQNSRGPHLFLQLGATPITSAADIIDLLSLSRTAAESTDSSTPPRPDLTTTEQTILAALTEPLDSDNLIRTTGLTAETVNITLTQMELAGHIIETNGTYRAII